MHRYFIAMLGLVAACILGNGGAHASDQFGDILSTEHQHSNSAVSTGMQIAFQELEHTIATGRSSSGQSREQLFVAMMASRVSVTGAFVYKSEFEGDKFYVLAKNNDPGTRLTYASLMGVTLMCAQNSRDTMLAALDEIADRRGRFTVSGTWSRFDDRGAVAQILTLADCSFEFTGP